MKLVNDYVLVERITEEKKTTSGLLYSQSESEVASKGKVAFKTDNFNENDIVLFKNVPRDMIVDGISYVLLNSADIIAVL